eukprot:jgi/Tetstr1/425352/TSEL_015801.t1
MESDDPAVVAMHLAYAATVDPSAYVRCVPRAGCRRSGLHVFHGAQAAARAATCEFCSPPPPTAPPPGVALPASAAGVRALQRQHAPAAASAAHDAALAATARWYATSDVYRKMPRHVDWWRWKHIRDLDVPSWRMWVNRCMAGWCHSRTAAFLASGTVFALHKDDPAARAERGKSGEPLRVRPLGVGSVPVRMASAHARSGASGRGCAGVPGPGATQLSVGSWL